MLSKTQIRLIVLIAVGVIVFYAIGVATDLFANEAFKPFFILSYSDAHAISIVLLAGAGAGALLSMVILVRKGKINLFSRKAPTTPTNTPAKKTEQKLPIEPKPAEPKTQPASNTVTQPKTPKKTDAPPIITQTSGIKTCPSCKKKFTTALYMLDYSSKTEKFIGYCPYCNTALETFQPST
jgi:hypothetical protein